MIYKKLLEPNFINFYHNYIGIYRMIIKLIKIKKNYINNKNINI